MHVHEYLQVRASMSMRGFKVAAIRLCIKPELSTNYEMDQVNQFTTHQSSD